MIDVRRKEMELNGAVISFTDGPEPTGDIHIDIEEQFENYLGRAIKVSEAISGELTLPHWPQQIQKFDNDDLPLEHDITATVPGEELQLDRVVFTDSHDGTVHDFIASDWEYQIEVS